MSNECLSRIFHFRQLVSSRPNLVSFIFPEACQNVFPSILSYLCKTNYTIYTVFALTQTITPALIVDLHVPVP